MARTSAKPSFWLPIVFILLVALWHKPILRIYFVLDYPTEIINSSRAHGISPALVSAVVFTESRFDPLARSHKGALGLMQIMPSTGNWVARQMNWPAFTTAGLMDPQKNLEVGTWYLAYLKKYFINNENGEFLALASYNAGLNYVREWVAQGFWDGDSVKADQIPFPETKKYILRIILLKKIYSYLYPELR